MPVFPLASTPARQLAELQQLIRRIGEQNRFYQGKFSDAGIAAPPESLSEFSRRFPFTSKSELARDHQQNPPYGSNLTYPVAHFTRCHQTSGTTGSPLRWLDTPDSWDHMTRDWAEIFRAAEIGSGDRILFAFSFGPFLGFWLA